MPYVTSIERLGREEGRQLALQEGILDLLEARFGQIPYGLTEQVKAVTTEPQLKRLLVQAGTVPDLSEFLSHFRD